MFTCIPLLLFYQGIDYDDDSGAYLGPGHNFDDEDLEYLNKDDFEDQLRLLHPTDPASQLIYNRNLPGI